MLSELPSKSVSSYTRYLEIDAPPFKNTGYIESETEDELDDSNLGVAGVLGTPQAVKLRTVELSLSPC